MSQQAPIATRTPLAAPQPPSVHVRAVITWIAIFPLVTLGFFATAPFAEDWNPVLRAFILSIVVVPVAVYLVVPQLMRAYGKIRAAFPRWFGGGGPMSVEEFFTSTGTSNLGFLPIGPHFEAVPRTTRTTRQFD